MTGTIEARQGRVALGVVRWCVVAHTVLIFAQPVLAGRYLIGDYDMLALHVIGADLVTFLGAAQLVATGVLWWRARTRWPFLATLALLAGESAQYYAGLFGGLDMHIPLGVALAMYAAVMVVAIWRPTGDER